jgi:two-component system, sensor histidine kinase LadS
MPLPFVAFSLRRWFWLWLAACLSLGGCQPLETPGEQPLVKSQQWLMDTSGTASLSDVQKATDWQPLTNWKTWGYGPETIWVRLDLHGTKNVTPQPWVVEVKPPYLDYVTLYDPTNGLTQRSGDALPPHDDELVTLNLTFQIPAMASERTVYLKVRSISTRMMQVKVMPYGMAQQANRQQEWLIGFIVVTSALFAIWALAQWLYSRDRVIGAFAVKQLMATAWGFLLLGFARVSVGPWLPEGLLSDMASTCFLWLISTTLWFLTVFMQEYKPSRWAVRACYALTVFLLVLPLLHWSGQPYLALRIGNFCMPLVMGLLAITLLSAWKKQPARMPIPLGFMLCYLCLYTLTTTVQPLMHLGWINANTITVFGTLAHTVLDGIVMFFVMQFRARTLAKEQQQVTLELYRSQEKIEAETRHREEQSQLFAMLAHEMKTPLATLRMWMDADQLKRDAMERAITDMNQVIERCVHTGQLADQGLEAVLQRVDPVELTRSCIQVCRAPDRVDLSAPEAGALLHTDPQMLSIVLGNLLDNACKYGASLGRIQVSLVAAQTDGRPGWLWHVTNLMGPVGLPEADRLFEKYYRSPQARRLSGSGLGLFLVKGLLNLLQGSIHYAAQDNHAVFSVWVPSYPDERW